MTPIQTDPIAADRELLERRARALARPPAQQSRDETIEVVTFRIAGERYAMQSREVLAVFALAALVPLPGATAPVAGVTVWRGNLLMLLDVRAMLGLSPAALNDLRMVVVIGDARAAAGILVDVLEGIASLPRADFRAVEGTDRSTHARGISGDGTILISGAALANHHATGGSK